MLRGQFSWSQASVFTWTMWGCLLFPSLPEWTLIRESYQCATASILNVHSAGGTSVEASANSPAAKSQWLVWTGPSNQGIVQEIESSKSVSLAPPRDSLKTDDYSSSIELDHFISAHVCRGLFLPSVLAYQSTLFIFIKEQNGNFDITSTSCISLFEVFWRYCV